MTFITGQSGNEKGRPPGVSDKRSRFRKLLEPHANELIEVLVKQAKNGEPTALRLCIERLIPKAKSETIDITVPDEITIESVAKMSDQVLRGIANQEITLEQGKDILQIIQSHANLGLTDLFNTVIELKNKLDQFIEDSLVGNYDRIKEIKNEPEKKLY